MNKEAPELTYRRSIAWCANLSRTSGIKRADVLVGGGKGGAKISKFHVGIVLILCYNGWK